MSSGIIALDMHRQHSFIETKTTHLFSLDTLRNILEFYSALDDFNEKNSFVCLWRDRLVWEHKKETGILKIERIVIKDTINKTELVDYNIFFRDNSDYTTIRFLNNSKLISITNFRNSIDRLMESVQIGFDELMQKQNEINTRIITCR